MPRSYSEEFIRHLYALPPESLGARLGKVCVEGNLPAQYVAKVLNVSRMTIHSWIRGGLTIRRNNAAVIEKFLALVEPDVREKNLPRNSVKDARAYLEEVATRMT